MWILIIIASLSAYAITSTWINNHRFENRVKSLNSNGSTSINDPQEHKVLQKEGYDIHYFTSGSTENELLIFLHAAFCDNRIFDHQVAFFSKKYGVITIDLLGHGLSHMKKSNDQIDSSTDHMLQIIEKEGYKKAHIIGVSMGSLVAQYFAFQYPDKVNSVTVVGGYDIHKNNSAIARAQIIEKLKWPLKIIFSMNAFRRYIASMSVINPVEQAKVYESTKSFTRSSFKVMRGLGKIDNIGLRSNRAYPLLLLVGDHDLDVSIKYSQKWQKEDPAIQFYLINNAGHNANMDNAEDFNKVLYDFLIGKS